MKLAKSLLLGSSTAFVAVAGANAADLPSKKAAPVNYVKVCDAYGAGFFNIPGTETCVKLGGRVRADYAFSNAQDLVATNAGTAFKAASTGSAATVTGTAYKAPNGQTDFVAPGAYYDATNSALVKNFATKKNATNMYGWEARARVDLDARTPTANGTVQAVSSIRLARTTGILDQVGPALSATSAGATLESAYIRFAGFTFGVAKDNFSFMPSTFYGAGHWSSFANGAKQLAYTAVLGGGFSATLAVQDATDTTAGGVVAAGYATPGVAAGFLVPGASTPLNSGGAAYAYNGTPQINGRIDYDQSWGTASVMGAVGQAKAINGNGVNFNVPTPQVAASDLQYNAKANVWALGAGVKVNLPALAAGDVLYLNGAYANGMTEYTTNWGSFKSSDTKLNIGGYVINQPSWVVAQDAAGNNNIETVKSWDVAALYTHFWSPEWRHSFLASYGKIDGTTTSKALAWGNAGAFGDAKVWNVGTQLAFLPTKDFEIGVDMLYARIVQDVRVLDLAPATFASSAVKVDGSSGVSRVVSQSAGNWTGRLRVERTF